MTDPLTLASLVISAGALGVGVAAWSRARKLKRTVRSLFEQGYVRANGERVDFPFGEPGMPRSWAERTRLVVACPDNRHIVRVENAGEAIDGFFVMHNGLRVLLDSYYGGPVTEMLRLNRGVHEPEEERVFQEVLPHIPRDGVMIELGAYWGFYSLWFRSVVGAGATNLLVEPEPEHLESGRRNFEAAGFSGVRIVRGFVGRRPRDGDPPTVSVDSLIASEGLSHVHLLHSDIQGHEAEMLRGAAKALRERTIDYIFLSTHSTRVHARCRRMLQRASYEILADSTVRESYSFDGLLVGRRRELAGLAPVDIAKRR